MKKQFDLVQVVQKAISFLEFNQQQNGSFLSYSSPHRNDFSKAKEMQTVFNCGLILSSLNATTCTVLDDTQASSRLQSIRSKLTQYLCSQRSQQWSFNYWHRDSLMSQHFTVPDDLDDTFCCLSALYGYQEELVPGQAFAEILRMLTAVEVKEGGPYRTWLIEDRQENQVWLDVDLAVNANVGYFLSLLDVNVPNLDAFFSSQIKKDSLFSKYYPTQIPVVYYLSRYYQQSQTPLHWELRQILVKKITKYLSDNQSLSSMERAVLISSLIRIAPIKGGAKKKVKESVYVLLKDQHVRGFWSAFGFCFDPMINEIQHFAGSQALSTALCIEAISLYRHTSEIRQKERLKKIKKKEIEKIQSQVIQYLEEIFQVDTANFLGKQSKKAITRIKDIDQDGKIILFPWNFRKSLTTEYQKKVSDTYIIKVCAASLLGWIAYTLFDDLLDGDGQIPNLPVATVSLREMTHLYTSIFQKNPQCLRFFHRVLFNLDQANYWEVSRCRVDPGKPITLSSIPDYHQYQQLADKSFGHAISLVSVLAKAGFRMNSEEVFAIQNFMRHYLVVRQIDDDAHDWQQDLEKGHLSSVVSMVLSEYFSIKKITQFQLTDMTWQELKKVFYRLVLPKVVSLIRKKTTDATAVIVKLQPIVKDTSFFDTLLAKHRSSADNAEKEQKRVLQFFEHY